MNKVNLSVIIGSITLLGIFSGLVLKFGSLPEAVASLQTRQQKLEDQYQEISGDLTEMKAEQRYVKEKTDDIYELIKNKVR